MFSSQLPVMDSRTRAIFGEIVKAYLETGEPVGSRKISRRGIALSPASIRNVMSDLCDMGLLDAPHASSGRAPTHAGLRVFVDGLLQTEELGENGKREIDQHLKHCSSDSELMAKASELLSGLSGCAGLVASPKREVAIRHVEFVCISSDQALAIIVTADNDVENRLLKIPPGLPGSALIEAGNYLNARMRGQSLEESLELIRQELKQQRADLDAAAAILVKSGLALWSGECADRGRSLIIRGRANLLEPETARSDLRRVRELFDELERKQTLMDVLDIAREADGVRMFIGAENPLFSLSGSSMILAPYVDAHRKVVGALGVIGPTRINYARVIPVVSYTAHSLGRLIGAVSGLSSNRQEE